jgi:hypothetical protein
VNSRFCVITLISASFALAASGLAKNQSQASGSNLKGASVSNQATGTFEVKLTPQTSSEGSQDANLGRMTIDKQFHGSLEGASKGQMLTAGTAVKGSAGYVAIEQVSGTLDGHNGTFILQHSATMTRGVPQLSVTVVPDSGTGELVGLSGKMNIIISEGKHSYEFEYMLPKTE